MKKLIRLILWHDFCNAYKMISKILNQPKINNTFKKRYINHEIKTGFKKLLNQLPFYLLKDECYKNFYYIPIIILLLNT